MSREVHRLLLASASPRRRALLEAAGVEVLVAPPAVDEGRLPGEHPVHLARRLARSKAEAARTAWTGPSLPVLAADTVVHAREPGQGPLEAAIFEKPRDEEDACRILARLSGRWHTVTTGFCLLAGDRGTLAHVSTRVRFRTLSQEQIRRYVATGEPLDKAGAYGIQGQGAVLVARVEGSYTNVVGLPLEAVLDSLAQLIPGR